MDRYSFLVRILPPLLPAGLARRTNISISLTDIQQSEKAVEEKGRIMQAATIRWDFLPGRADERSTQRWDKILRL